MDPVATVVWAYQAYENGELTKALDYIGDYMSWRFRGGYNPDNAWHGGEQPLCGDRAILNLMETIAIYAQPLNAPS